MPDDQTLATSRAGRLRAATQGLHETLDRSIMGRGAFASLEGYGRFVRLQDAFHHDIAALYEDPGLNALIRDLAARSRAARTRADLADLAVPPLAPREPLFAPERPVDSATALGWLYVAEGSNLGAALLRKEVARFGLGDDFGARHLAPAPEGPAAHWRRFVAALDSLPLDPAQDARAEDAACTAFAHVQALADACLGKA